MYKKKNSKKIQEKDQLSIILSSVQEEDFWI